MFNAKPPRRQVLEHAVAAAAGLMLPLSAARAVTAVGQRVVWPEVALLDGSRWGAKQAEGRAVVAVFWSVTCPFCRRHNEHVEKLHRAAANKALTVLSISRDKDPSAVKRYAAERGYSFPITMDEAPLHTLLATRRVIPLTVTVDRQGRLVQSYPGEMFEEDVLELLALADGKPR